MFCDLYYLSFFIDNRPFFDWELTLAKFIDTTKSLAYFVESGKVQEPDHVQSLPEEEYPPKCWYIYSPAKSSSSRKTIPNINLLNSSIYERYQVIQSVIKKSDWVVLSWGGLGDFKTILFVANQEHYRDILAGQSLQKNSKKIDSMSEYYLEQKPIINKLNQLIVRNLETNCLENSCNALLFTETISEIGSRVWDACKFDESFPWVISICNDPNLYNFYEYTPPDKVYSEEWKSYWDCADYNPIKTLRINNFHIGVYQPKGKASFRYMCQSIYQGNEDLLVIVPSNTNFDTLVKLLEKTEIIGQYYHSVYSPLIYISDILKSVEWFYGLNRSHGDHCYSLFVARDSEFILKVDSFNRDDGYRLVSCF